MNPTLTRDIDTTGLRYELGPLAYFGLIVENFPMKQVDPVQFQVEMTEDLKKREKGESI